MFDITAVRDGGYVSPLSLKLTVVPDANPPAGKAFEIVKVEVVFE